ncbi:MAG: N-methyl-L-tryptophan oxidase [Chthoniobacterales bacterium]|nr:N-methyl-L-tryptophan oxidase [Chthoniobacterales bacterium]
MTYDVAIVGLGAMGSAIAAHCAARGAHVIGLEQFERGHELGASSGKTRLIRTAYFEDVAYVPLVQRAYELWRELERASGEELLRRIGVLYVGEEGSNVIEGTQRAARQHRLPIESFSGHQVTSRYPNLKLLPEEVGLFEKEAGVLNPERANDVHQKRAEATGAEFRFCAAVKDWDFAGSKIRMRLQDGARVKARKVALALGPWFQATLLALGVPLRVQRNVQAWFTPGTDAYDAGKFPAFLLNRRGLPAPLYGFPDFGDGVKAAFHGFGELTDPDHVDREVNAGRDIEPLVRGMEMWMPGSARTFRAAKPCMYSLTPDENFVVDRHPRHANVLLCGGFSGHGFKFAPVIGEIAADLLLEGGSRHPIEFLSLRRFQA